MLRLIHIEIKKILDYKTFWVIVGLYVVALGFTLFVSQLVINNIVVQAGKSAPIPIPKISLFHFPKIWHNMAYIAGYFNLFLAIIIITLVCNEFSFKTIRQNIINGMSRAEYLLSKLYLIVIISLSATLLVFLIGLVLGLIHSSSPEMSNIFHVKLQFFVGYFLEVLTYMIFAFFLAFLFKRAGLTIIFLLFYTVIEQIIVWWKIPSEWVKVMPMKAFGRLVHFPSIPLPEMNGQGLKFQDYVALPEIGIAIFYAAVMIAVIYYHLKKLDI
jgi:ABC-type transport system involved in multi-copper enzyme maturation permease subunit